MRNWIIRAALGCLIVATSSILPVLSSVGHASPQDDAYQVVVRWAEAFNSADPENVASCYTSDATLFGTVSRVLASTPKDVVNYYTPLPKLKLQVKLAEYSAMRLSDDAFLFAGHYDFSDIARNGETKIIPARYTILVTKQNGNWLIRHHHSSVRPSGLP